ncbi:MAG: heat-inducible transcriptional repressor HrcA [Gemmatimonadota bacterium]|nr:heat-inducible transcriptional repressor HrcA [Gemmatimonadota bacterium]
MTLESLTDRERSILHAALQSYISNVSPVGSRSLERSSGLGLSAATIRNTMSDLEQKGYLYKPHTSAGRVPTDKAYRLYVDSLDSSLRETSPSVVRILQHVQDNPVLDRVLRRAAEALGVITRELGVGIAPVLGEGVLERVDLIRVSSERVMLVLAIGQGMVKTIFIELDSRVDGDRLSGVVSRLNERLCGLTLSDIRRTAGQRLKGAVRESDDPLNIFIQSAETLFDLDEQGSELILGETSSLASQPEFNDEGGLRSLIQLTDKKDLLLEVMRQRAGSDGLRISIGSENELSELSNFTLITDTYRIGKMKGIIGVIGPTRMSYNRVISVVEYTSRLLSNVLGKN